MNKTELILMIFNLALIFLVIVLIVSISAPRYPLPDFHDNSTYLMMVNCCDGSYCTDTYYTLEDNTCHLVLCEDSFFTNKDNCTYKGRNLS